MNQISAASQSQSTRNASLWLLLAFAYAVLSIPGLLYLGRDEFTIAFGARIVLSFASLVMALWNLAGNKTSDRVIGVLIFGTAFAVESWCAIRFAQIQPGFLVLVLWAIGFPIASQRRRRLVLQDSANGLRQTLRQTQRSLAELHRAVDGYRINLDLAQQKQESELMAQVSNASRTEFNLSPIVESVEMLPVEDNGNSLSLATLSSICERNINEKRTQIDPKKRVALVFNRPQVLPTQVTALAEASDLSRVLGGLVELAMNSLSGGEGLVRVSLNPGLRLVTISIEDNGYGISEERLIKSQASARAAGDLTFAQMRGLVEFWGGRLMRHARLGVGSRVVLELPRTDAYSFETTNNGSYRPLPDPELPR